MSDALKTLAGVVLVGAGVSTAVLFGGAGTVGCDVVTVVDGGTVYSRQTFDVTKDGGIDARGLTVVQDSCREVPKLRAALGGRNVPQECACRGSSGDCKVSDPKGIPADAPLGVTLGPESAWAGPGCIPKACVEMAGASSWPSACPKPRRITKPFVAKRKP